LPASTYARIPIDTSNANAANDEYTYDQKLAIATASAQVSADYMKKRADEAKAKAQAQAANGKQPGKGKKFFVAEESDDE
jgi:hypothetical protein